MLFKGNSVLYYIIGIFFANNISFGHNGQDIDFFCLTSFIRLARKGCHF